MAEGVNVYIDPFSHHFYGDAFFEAQNVPLVGDDILAPFAFLKQWLEARGIRVRTAERLLSGERFPGKNLYVSLGIRDNYRQLAARSDVRLSAFFAFECPIVEPSLYRELGRAQRYFKRIFSWSDGSSLERFVGKPLRCEHFFWPQSFNQVHERVWSNEDRQFLVMINANKLPRVYWQELYTERMRAVAWFAERNEINLYGKGWDEPSKRMGKTWVPWTLRIWLEQLERMRQRKWPDPLLTGIRRAYRGPAESKVEVLGKHNFALCYENMIFKGWITEKIFDCFFAGTIPVYWGEPEIEKYVPPNCFIDRRKFKDYAQLYDFLKTLGPQEIRAYKQNAKAFLASPAYFPFTKEAFVEHFRRIIEEDAGVKLAP